MLYINSYAEKIYSPTWNQYHRSYDLVRLNTKVAVNIFKMKIIVLVYFFVNAFVYNTINGIELEGNCETLESEIHLIKG